MCFKGTTFTQIQAYLQMLSLWLYLLLRLDSVENDIAEMFSD